jgi:hypothetical protein
MIIRWRRGRLLLAGISAAALAVAAVPEAEQPAPAVPTRAAEPSRPKSTAQERAGVQLDMARLRRLQPAGDDASAAPDASEEPAGAVTPAVAEIVDAFATHSWYVPPPPPPPVKPEPPPKPTAPPLPFTYMGRYDSTEGPPVILLVRGDLLYTVSEGDSIDGIYRIDRVERGRVELTYLPLQQKQVLQTGEAG